MLAEAALAASRAPASALLEIRGIRVAFGDFVAIDDLTLSIEDRRIATIIGPNGAGKSTLLDAICGKTKLQSGSIALRGERISGRSPIAIARMGIGRKFQVPSIYAELTLTENVRIALRGPRGVAAAFFSREPRDIAERVERVLERVGLIARRDRLAGILSHGEQQWLEIGLVLAQDPALILLDEPTAGMTRGETERTAELVGAIVRDHAIVIIEHDMAFVRQIAERVTVLHQGRLLAQGSLAEIQRDPRVIESYLGREAIDA